MAKKDLDGIDFILLILFLPFVIGYFLIVGIVKLIGKVNENTENYTRNGSGRKDFIPKSNKKILYVEQNSKMCKELEEINKKYRFAYIQCPVYTITCDTLREYQRLDCIDEAKKKFTIYYEDIVKLYKKAEENGKVWREYLKEYSDAEQYMSVEEIEALPQRKIKVKTFMLLEKELFINKKLNSPTTRISLSCKIKYTSPQGRNSYEKDHTLSHYDIATVVKAKEKKEEELRERERKESLRLHAEQERLQKEKERKEEEQRKQKAIEEQRKRDFAFVAENSKAYQTILLLNKKYFFHNVGVPIFKINCGSSTQYSNFSTIKYFKGQFTENPLKFEEFFKKVDENRERYSQYNLEYQGCENYFPSECMVELTTMTLEKFYSIEKKLYKQAKIIPFMEKKLRYIIEYTSPSGRNSYRRDEYLYEEDIKRAIEQLIIEDETRKQKELAKQQRAQEQAEIRALLKNKGKLEQKEAELAQREQEFQRATRGHIYAVSDIPAPVEVEQPKIETTEESLSAWGKMKRLKKDYENGEITYEEYNEKRKHLL